jgi:hypothetical protein
MSKKTYAYVFAIFGLSATGFAQGNNAGKFAAADALFAARNSTVESIVAARDAYKAIVAGGAKDAELVRAVEGIARTYLYQGEILTPKDTAEQKKARKAIFNECWDKALEPISPKKLGSSTPVYFYWKASCMAHEAEVSTTLERLLNLPTLLDTFSKGLETSGGDVYEGGGLKRVKAVVKGNVEAKGLPGGLYNPEESLKLVEESINAEAYPGNVEGFLFCENFYRKATILQTLGRDAEAKELAGTTVTEFNQYLADGLIPEMIRVETSYCVQQVQGLIKGS